MGFFTAAFEKRRVFGQQWLDMLAGINYGTASGITVTTEGSLQNSAVYACIRVLAETVASLPLFVYERRSDGGKKRAVNNPLYRILHTLPNPEMTSLELRETLMGHLLLWGNAYAEIERNGAGQVKGLWPLRPDQMTVKRSSGALIYSYRLPDGKETTIQGPQVLHIRGLSPDGIMGYSPIAMARQAIGLGLATEEFGARFFGNGARPGAVLEHPGLLGNEAQSRLRRSIEAAHQGLSNSHRLMILEEGMKLQTIGIPPEDAQFLETRRFQVSEIARIYRVPPHLIGDLDRATFSNVEQQAIDFVTHTIRPWLVRWEQAINRDLISPAKRQMIFVEHLIDGLLRGDIASRYAAYATGRQNGWLSANDIRTLENQNPIEGGDIYLVPLNMMPADQLGESDFGEARAWPAAGIIPQNIEARSQQIALGRQRLARNYERLFLEAAGRVVNREIADVRRAIKKYFGKRDALQFLTWLKQFYEDHRRFWIRQMTPILLSYADQIGIDVADELGGDPKTAEDIEAFIDQYADTLASREANNSHGQLRAIVEELTAAGDDPEPALTQRLDEWDEKRAGKVASNETFQSLNAFVKTFYVASGVTLLKWQTTGDNCPYCKALSGRVVGIQENFLGKNSNFQPDGAETPLNIRHDAGHPPIHAGCDCAIVAG